MLSITIDERLRAMLPDFAVGVIEVPWLRVTEHDPALWGEIDARLDEITRTLAGTDDIPQMPGVAALRKAYRTLGKDPTRYRGSQESLCRRVLKGKGLYRINTVVDINNLVSLEYFTSIGMFDAALIDPPVVVRAGLPGETYYGIGRDLLNVEGLPLLADRQGPFGSPTSDSERTKVTLNTTSTLTAILSFTGRENLEARCHRMCDLLCRYAGADRSDIAIRIV